MTTLIHLSHTTYIVQKAYSFSAALNAAAVPPREGITEQQRRMYKTALLRITDFMESGADGISVCIHYDQCAPRHQHMVEVKLGSLGTSQQMASCMSISIPWVLDSDPLTVAESTLSEVIYIYDTCMGAVIQEAASKWQAIKAELAKA